jgi:hypothetical protein
MCLLRKKIQLVPPFPWPRLVGIEPPPPTTNVHVSLSSEVNSRYKAPPRPPPLIQHPKRKEKRSRTEPLVEKTSTVVYPSYVLCVYDPDATVNKLAAAPADPWTAWDETRLR